MEIFNKILQDDETIIWSNGVNRKSYLLKKQLTTTLACAFIGLFISFFIGGIATGIISSQYEGLNEISTMFKVIGILWLAIFSIGFIISFINNYFNAKNTYLAITNKRVIKRSGAFSDKFIHYSLRNVGNIEVCGSLLDSKDQNASANLIISTKDFHTNTDGNTRPVRLVITSLNNAYEAYKVLSKETEGHNEVLRIKKEN